MLGLAKRLKAKILQASTSEVYGDPAVHPQTEDYWGNVNPIGPRACYDEGKRCAETLFFDYHRQHGLRIKVARIFNTYGPRMHPNDGRVVSNFIVQALTGRTITVYGDGRQTRSFCYVDDLVDGLIRLMDTRRRRSPGPINLGNPGEFTILELAEKVIELTGSRSKIVHAPSAGRRPEAAPAGHHPGQGSPGLGARPSPSTRAWTAPSPGSSASSAARTRDESASAVRPMDPMSGRRLVAVNRFYWPDHAATSQLLTDLARHMAEEGWTVTVVASRLRYDDPSAVLPALETHGGCADPPGVDQPLRPPLATGPRDRLCDLLPDGFRGAAAGGAARRRAAGQDRSAAAARSSRPWSQRLKGAELVTWCQDLFPEIAAALGMRWASGPIGRLLGRLRDRSLRSARQNVTLCETMRRHLLARGIPADRLTVIHNWADDDLIRPVPPAANPLRREWGLQGRRVIGYSGNLGRAHDLAGVQAFIETMTAADPDLVFLFIGGGAGFAELERWAGARGLTHVMFRPYQPRERLADSLSVPDLHLVSLDPACEGLIMPSKLYGILAAGRPIVALASADGSLAQFVHEMDCGLVWQKEAAAQVLELIERMAADARPAGQDQAVRRAVRAAEGLGGLGAVIEDVAPQVETSAAVGTVRHAA